MNSMEKLKECCRELSRHPSMRECSGDFLPSKENSTRPGYHLFINCYVEWDFIADPQGRNLLSNSRSLVELVYRKVIDCGVVQFRRKVVRTINISIFCKMDSQARRVYRLTSITMAQFFGLRFKGVAKNLEEIMDSKSGELMESSTADWTFFNMMR